MGQVDDEITREDGIADCLAPKLSSQIVEAVVEEPVEFDRTLARIATGVWYLGGTFNEVAAAYKGCDELDDDIEKMMDIYDKHFKDIFASLSSFAAILSVVEAKKDDILPLTTEYGSGKNAAK